MKYFEQPIEVQTEGVTDYKARLIAYIPDLCPSQALTHIRQAVLILPGGAYRYTSPREAEPIALKFMTEGICAFVLHYSVETARFPQALCEALSAVKYIRENANEWRIDPNNINVCGFSAGGHLCASVGVFWNKTFVEKYLGKNHELYKPNRLILSYPVITSGEFTHQDSIDYLLGDNKSDERLELVSLEKQVNGDVPPCFVWHTYEDKAVPVQNTLLFANALVANNIPLELHIYRRGEHGLSLGNHIVCDDRKYGDDHMSSDWIDKAMRFMLE